MIRQIEVDGVPTLLAATTGPMHAGLMFRVGQADETLARRGITHLLEHLVLFPVGTADYHYNGTTGSVITYFHLQGSAADITTFLVGVCRSLRDLATDRLETEKTILRTEWSGKNGSVTDSMPLWRHGARDYGLVSYPEWGLSGLTGDDLREWVARYFTRENAVLWIAGDEVPPGLTLDLPSGRRMPAPVASSALPVTPAFFSGNSRATALDAVVPRSIAATVFTGVLERELFRSLRQQGGLSYTAATNYDPRGDGFAVITALADALPEKQDAVLGGFVDVLAKLRVGRVDEADLVAVVGKATESLTTAEADAARLPSAAFNLLTGHPFQSSDELVQELKEVTVEQVHAVTGVALESSLLMTPHRRTADWAGFVAAPNGSTEAVEGTTYPGLGNVSSRLVVGESGVSLVPEEGDPDTVRFDECVVMLAWPDGGRQLIGADAITVRVEPTLYRDANPSDIDARVPAGVRVDLPARSPEQIPRPETVDPSAGKGIRGRLSAERIQIIGLGVVTVLLGLVALGGTVAMIVDSTEVRPLTLIGVWIIVGYVGRNFLAKWRER
ncbi:M16 family metallopeptidase [Micromonospora sp. NPDC050397]|uniref:M16 family metallopeptidase n=1 Tax=Micromonospora sp. NPDC050397 TaxID=3364279 RepID=UPI00384D4648